jgi:hypothetical protein
MPEMLGETKTSILNILTKLQAYESALASINTTHPDHKEEANKQHKDISARKLVLTAELHRLLS